MSPFTSLLKGVHMAKVAPFHSVKQNEPQVYHDNSSCKTGNNIEKENRREGTGGRAKCSECAKLS
jgi:hypothetical protein